jgi:hypothetical protein
VVLGRRYQARFVARETDGFFRRLSNEDRSDPKRVAQLYGNHFCGVDGQIIRRRKVAASSFDIGIAMGDGPFDLVTMRADLISETLLLSHGTSDKWREWSRYCHGCDLKAQFDREMEYGNAHLPALGPGDEGVAPVDWKLRAWRSHRCSAHVQMRCPSLNKLGRWLLDAEPLLRAGLVWYLPSFSPEPVLSLLTGSRRAIDASGVSPGASGLVRPVAQLDVPFVADVAMHDFSRITVDALDSHRTFRDFLRTSYRRMDRALEGTQPGRDLARVGSEIADQMRLVQAEMSTVTSEPAGLVGADLVAVYGPAFRKALGAEDATNGLWAPLADMAESNTSLPRGEKWCYVWVLTDGVRSGKSRVDG